MLKHLSFQVILLCSLLIVMTSCDKFHTKKLAGTYSCTVDYHYWDISPTIIDSSYLEEIEIKQEGKNVMILNYSIHIDSLWKEKDYSQGNIHDYIKVMFRNDSIYITRSSGGLGGNASWTYAGIKKKN